MFIDSHCHINDDETVMRAYAAGVGGMLNAGNDVDEAQAQLEMCRRFYERYLAGEEVPLVWTSVGVHPDSAKDKLDKVGVEELLKAIRDPFVVAIGECGLDYHYGAETKAEQKEMFLRHVKAAGISGLPLMIHQREAEGDMLEILKDGQKEYPNLTGVIHCFSSDQKFAEEIDGLGFYISASGIITFNSAEDIRDVFKNYPKDRILIETDSPYLAPVPFRGKENEPAYVVKTAEKLAQIKNVGIEEMMCITKENFYRLYQKARGQRRV